MQKWWLKAGLQGVMSVLPASTRLNYFFQRRVSKGLRLNQRFFDIKLADCKRHLEHYALARGSAAGGLPPTVLELGTGWQPVVPIALYLCGVERVISVDKVGLLRPQLVREVIAFFLNNAATHGPTPYFPFKPERLAGLKAALDASDVIVHLSALGVMFTVADARRLEASADEIALIISNNTLEHIPLDVMQAIFAAFRRIATPRTVMSHFIDLADHYSYFDRGITPYNFLKISGWSWWIFNNSLQYQNRLRVREYRQLHHDTGFDVIHEENTSADPNCAAGLQLAAAFKGYSLEELCVTGSWMVSVPKGSS
jgi:hypothetical protein